MYVPTRLKRARKSPYKLSFAAGVAKKRKQRRQNRPGTPTKTLECTEVSFPPTQSLAIRQKHDVPPGAVVSATAYKHAPPGAVASTMTPEVLGTLPEPCSSEVFGVWLLDQIEHIYTEHRSYCLKDDENGFPSKTQLGMVEVTVPDNGQAIPFEAMSASHPNFQKIQLLQGVQFIFYSPESLLRFTSILISTLFLPHPQPIVPWVHIKLIIFDPTCLPEAPELMAWEEIGVDQDPPASRTLAYKHYDDWMKAVQRFCKLPLVVLATLHFCYPYRNFDNLESLSRPLRITENLGLLPIDFEEES
ncbi:hypothetical protein FPHYL_4895 [Fusarium phyllophilum]|uniref:Uncharacterized protein n=1 Tax=Fusarium phyllophilum TaxID=47803 RepID=A0A8H5K2U4_9HYPO|nr:hypothetical protein FPHYL_4895 [Fusarium phyllophilum]